MRPARVEPDVVAVDDERRNALENRRLLRVADTCGLDRDERFDLVGPRLRHLEAELPRLRVKEDHARAHLVDQRDVSADDRVVGGGPARHVLLHEIVVGLDRELARRHQLLLRRIGAVGARALPDAKALEGIGFSEEHRLALENVREHRPARAPADVERAHVAEGVGSGGAGGEDRSGYWNDYCTHRVRSQRFGLRTPWSRRPGLSTYRVAND